MAIRLEGNFETHRTPHEVYEFLTDPEKFARLLPNFQGVTRHDATHFTVKVDSGMPYVVQAVEMKMELTDAERPTRAQYKGKGSVAGAHVLLTAAFDLVPAEAGTKVSWQGDAELSHGLAAFAAGMLEPMAKKNVMKLIDGLQAALK
jgi:uncharacterized protein